jgi:hypothetical protein
LLDVDVTRIRKIANSYVDQQQEVKEREDVLAREERRLEERKAGKARIENSVITGIQLF